MMLYIWGLLFPNSKTRLTKAQLIKLVLQYTDQCECEPDKLTLQGEGNGYKVTIEVVADQSKA